MPPITIIIIDPANYRWVQDVEAQAAVKQILPPVVKRIGLPDNVRYELVRPVNGRALAEGQSLAQAGVRPREALWLRPVRDGFLAKVLEKLYEQAAESIAGRLWDAAEDQLETLFRLEPGFPDSRGLRQELAKASGRLVGAPFQTPGGPGYQGQGFQTPQPGYQGQGFQAPLPPAAPYPGGAPPAPPPPAPAYYPPRPAPRRGPSAGCVILGVLGALAGVVALGAAGLYALFNIAANTTTVGGPEPVLGTGDVQVTLRWDGPADLDLHVLDPGQEEIWFGAPSSSSGGRLDVDAHQQCTTDAPVENIFWPTGGAPRGRYGVLVYYFEACSAGVTSYTVTITLDGQVADEYSGTLDGVGSSELVAEFDY